MGNDIRIDLLKKVEKVLEERKYRQSLTLENYNIFDIIGKGHLEDLHSNYIANLLNPKGSHNQGSIFLKEFLNILNIDWLNADEASVLREVSIPNGRFDIQITDRHNIIVIENKVYSDVGDKQLGRYMESIISKKFLRRKLIYLTLKYDFDFSEQDTLTKRTIPKAEKDFLRHQGIEKEEYFDYYNHITYETDIINWIETCKKLSIDLPQIKEVLSHYLKQIKKITNQNNIKMDKEIKEYVLKEKDRFDAFLSLSNEDPYKEITNSIVEKIRSDLLADKELELSDKNVKNTVLENNNENEKGLEIYATYLNQRGLRFRFSSESKKFNGKFYFGFNSLSGERKFSKTEIDNFCDEFEFGKDEGIDYTWWPWHKYCVDNDITEIYPFDDEDHRNRYQEVINEIKAKLKAVKSKS